MRQLLAVFALLGMLAGCGGDSGGSPTSPSPAPTINVPFSATDLRVGTGAEATTGRLVTVRYSGWLYSTTAADNKGTPFDSNTINVTVGQGVIQGFSMGLIGMRVGGARRVVIPPNLGYGNNSPGAPIRPNETLLFEIELLAVQ